MQGGRPAVVWVAIVAASSGCGGALASSPQDAGADAEPDALGDVSAPDAPGPWSTACPESLPPAGRLCTDFSLDCQYGCDVLVTCSDYGNWQPSPDRACLPPCSDGGAPPNPAACPPDIASIEGYPPCDATGVTCAYPQGNCVCIQSTGVNPGSVWACGPGPGCPPERPRIGATCTPSARPDCNYEPGNVSIVCGMYGVWQFSPHPQADPACSLADGG
jgi:hypothetical protein